MDSRCTGASVWTAPSPRDPETEIEKRPIAPPAEREASGNPLEGGLYTHSSFAFCFAVFPRNGKT